MWFAKGEGWERGWKPPSHYRKAPEGGSLIFRVKRALQFRTLEFLEAGRQNWGENPTQARQLTPSVSWRTWRGLSAFACFKVWAAGELSPWPFLAQCKGEKDHLPVTSPSPEGCGSVSRAYVSGMLQTLRGAQLTCLTVPSGPAPSMGWLQPGHRRRGGRCCLRWSSHGLQWGLGSHCACPSQQGAH